MREGAALSNASQLESGLQWIGLIKSKIAVIVRKAEVNNHWMIDFNHIC